MNHKKTLAACLLLACAGPCLGWGADGHRITGEIASRHLTDEAREAIQRLIGRQPLALATTWADEIKGDSRYDWARPMHYVNMPRGTTAFDMERDCAKRTCVVAAITDNAAKLRDEDTPRAERIEALKFLVHFVGDVHQPLHACYGEDRGGNDVEVRFRGRPTNLHRLWDTDMIRAEMPGTWKAYAEAIDARITPEQRVAWRTTRTPEAWADESFAIARERVYPESPTIDDAYVRASMPLVEERLAIAGIRMADLLNRIFDPNLAAGDEEEPVEPEPEPEPAPPAAPRTFATIVTGEACGNADGELAYLVNGHAEKTIRVRVEQTWTVDGDAKTKMRTFTVKTGAPNRKELGCSARALRDGRVGRFAWAIVDAEWR